MKDISDRLNPLVIKEIRQDLRLKTFTHFFIWPQVILGLFMLANLDSATGNANATVGVAWLAVLFPLIFFLPRRAFLTFTREEQANSLELLLLTRLSAWRIVWGKWLALLLQSSLFVVAITPYLMAHYLVFGGDLILTFELLFLLFIGSSLLLATGAAAGASSRKRSSVLPAQLGGVLVIFLAGTVFQRAFFSTGYSSTSFSGSLLGWKDYISLLTLVPLIISIALSVGVSLIAPVQLDNAPTLRGLIATFVVVGTLLILTDVGSTTIIPPVMVSVLTPLGIYLMHERIHPLTWRKREKYGPLAWLVTSGWPGGVLLALLLLAIVITLIASFGPLTARNAVLAFFCISAGLLLPRTLLFVFAGGRSGQMSVFQYLLIQAILATIQVVFFSAKVNFLGSAFPLGAGLVVMLEGTRVPSEFYLGVSCVSAAIVFLFLLIELARTIKEVDAFASRYRLPPESPASP